MSDFTPTTEQVRKAYVHAFAPQQFFGPVAGADRAGLGGDFDRWLAAHDAELRRQMAADVAHAIDTHVMTWDETTAPHVRKGWRIARSIALDTITNPKEQS